MELFIFFLFSCFFAGLLLPKLRLLHLGWMLMALCALVTAGYFFVSRLI